MLALPGERADWSRGCVGQRERQDEASGKSVTVAVGDENGFGTVVSTVLQSARGRGLEGRTKGAALREAKGERGV